MEMTYNVYNIWEGAVFTEESFDDYDSAVGFFNELCENAMEGESVHLYDTVYNCLVIEHFEPVE